MTINEAMAALVNELVEGDVPDPLAQRFRLDFVWADLARLAGEPLPRAVAVLAEELPVRLGPAALDTPHRAARRASA